jgi:hypothetical protein
MPRSAEELRKRRNLQQALLEDRVDHRPKRRRIRLSRGPDSLGHELSVQGIRFALSCAAVWLLACQLLPEGSTALEALGHFRWGGPVLAACIGLILHGLVAKEPDEALEGTFAVFFVPLLWIRDLPAWLSTPQGMLFFILFMFLAPQVMSLVANPDPNTTGEGRVGVGCLLVGLAMYAAIQYVDANMFDMESVFAPLFESPWD